MACNLLARFVFLLMVAKHSLFPAGGCVTGFIIPLWHCVINGSECLWDMPISRVWLQSFNEDNRWGCALWLFPHLLKIRRGGVDGQLMQSSGAQESRPVIAPEFSWQHNRESSPPFLTRLYNGMQSVDVQISNPQSISILRFWSLQPQAIKRTRLKIMKFVQGKSKTILWQNGKLVGAEVYGNVGSHRCSE